MSDGFWRGLFSIAALFNLAAGVPPLVAPQRALEMLGMAPLPDPLFLRTTGLLVACFGVGYWLVSRSLDRHEIVWLGILGKLGVVVLFASGWLQGSSSGRTAALGMGDLLFVVAFAVFLATHRRGG